MIAKASQLTYYTAKMLLYQPIQNKQLLLYDAASSSAVLTYLRMNNIHVTVKEVSNAEWMSEDGRLPVVIDSEPDQDRSSGGNLNNFTFNKDRPLCGFREVFWHVARRNNRTPTLLELSYIDWIESSFLEAEMYLSWCHAPITNEYTKPRYTYDLPWPVSTILFNRKKSYMQANHGRKYRDFDDFLMKFNQLLTQIGKIVGHRPFCPMDSDPSAINALIYGHANAFLKTGLHPKLVNAVTVQRRINILAENIENKYYN